MNVVMFCGGRGGARLFEQYASHAHVTIVVNAYDDGASSGLLRRWVPEAPGWSDLRKNIARIRNETWWNERVKNVPIYGDLYHGALGNIIMHHTWESCHRDLPRVLSSLTYGLPHRILHVTENGPYVRLRALYADGVIAEDEATIVTPRSSHIVSLLTDFSQLVLNSEVIRALRNADTVLYAPGSVYSSLLPTYLTPGLPEVLRSLRVPRLLFRNATTDDGGITPEQAVARQIEVLGAAVTDVV